MKLLAILRDSFRETTDFKVFHVVIGLSILLTALTVCITFPRLAPEKMLENNLRAGRNSAPEFTVDNLTIVERNPLTSHARYRCTLMPASSDRLASRLRQGIQHRVEQQEEALAFQRFNLGLGDGSTDFNPERFGQQVFTLAQKRITARLAELLPSKDDPGNAAQWEELVDSFVKTAPGITQTKVEVGTPGEGGIPKDFQLDVTVNWAELKHAHQVGLLFGLWKFDLGEATLAGFMGSLVYPALINWMAGWVGIIIAVVITAGFIPNMLTKGTVDLLLVKPISRPALLIYKYLGGLAFIFINAAVFVGGTWLAFGFSTGNWSPWYLASALVLVIYFAILYALSVLIGVLTRSPLAAILITIGFWVILTLVSFAYTQVHRPTYEKMIKEQSTVVLPIIDTVHYVLPRPGDLIVLNRFLILRASGSEELLKLHEEAEGKVSWGESVTVSLAFIAVTLGFACWRFSRRDF